jgi:hypothetical protein
MTKRNYAKKNSLNVVPTVLIFKKGKVTKRLDGTSGAGLNEKQLKNLMSANVSCVKKKGRGLFKYLCAFKCDPSDD